MQKPALYVAGIIFAAGAVGHAVRLIMDLEIPVAGAAAPVWLSYPGVLAAALLAVWMLVAAARA